MLTWIKFGCGHLIAVPLLLIAVFAVFLMTAGSGSSLEELLLLLGVVLGAGGIGASILVYVWRTFWKNLSNRRLYAVDASPTADDRQSRAPSEEQGRSASERAEQKSSSPSPTPSASAPDEPSTPPTPRLPADERPWKEREEWADGQITTGRGTHDNIASARTVVILGGVTLAIGLGLGAVSFWGSDNPWVLALIVGLVGLGVMALGIYRMRRRQRFGTTTFEMDTVPGALGGPLCGILHTGVRSQDAPPDGFRVKLSCYRRRVTRDSDGGRDVDRSLLWRDEKRIEGRPSASRDTLDVPVAFHLPTNKPASTAERTPNRYQWMLEVSAEVRGVDYAAILEVPVFPVAPDETAPVEAYAEYELDHDAETPTSDGIILSRPNEETLHVVFGRARRPWLASGFTLGAVLLVGFVVGTAGSHLGAALLLAIMTLLVGWGAIYFWTYRSEVTVDETGITVRAGTIGRETSTRLSCAELHGVRVVASGDAYDLHLHRSGSSSPSPNTERMKRAMTSLSPQNPSTGESWNKYLERHGMTENRVVAARLLTNHQEAEWLASQIEQVAARHVSVNDRSLQKGCDPVA